MSLRKPSDTVMTRRLESTNSSSRAKETAALSRAVDLPDIFCEERTIYIRPRTGFDCLPGGRCLPHAAMVDTNRRGIRPCKCSMLCLVYLY